MRATSRLATAAGIGSLGLALALAGCVDFIAPVGRAGDLPTRLVVTVNVGRDPALSCPGCITADFQRIPGPPVTGPDSAVVWVDGSLDPGTDPAGDTRTVLDPTLRLLGATLQPTDSSALGVRTYRYWWVVPGDTLPLLVPVAPRLDGIAAPDPLAHWSVPWTQSADTLRIAAGQDLPLPITVRPAADQPAPDLRNWSVVVQGRSAFRIGADGPPPDTLLIPARFLPAPADSTLVARMSIVQALTPQPQQNYQVVFVLYVDLAWIIVQTPAGVR